MGEEKYWKNYEEISQYFLNKYASQFGMSRFVGKQKVKGVSSGTEWEIDAKGIKDNSDIFIIVECRMHTKSKLKQEELGGFAYRISDTGSQGGITVSPLGLQEGAKKIANAENIITVILSEDSTPDDFKIQFLDKIFIGLYDRIKISDSGKAITHRADGSIEQNFF